MSYYTRQDIDEIFSQADAESEATGKKLPREQIIQAMVDRGDEIEGLNAPAKKVQTAQQQLSGKMFNQASDPLGVFASGAVRAAEYIASPIAAASGFIQKGLLPESKEQLSQDVRELPQQAAMARTSLPLTVGLATAPLSLGAGALATGAAAATGRSMLEASDAITGKDQQSLAGRVLDVAKEGVAVGLTDLAFGKAAQYGGKIVKSLYSPLAGRFNSEVAQLAASKGIRLPVSSLSDSNIAKSMEAVSQKGLFGGGLEEMLEEANGKLSKLADDMVGKLSSSSDLTIAGKSVQEGANAYREAWRALKNRAYAIADEALTAGDQGSFLPNTDNTKALLRDVLMKKMDASQLLGDVPTSDAATGILATLLKKLESGETIPLRAYTSALDELNTLTKFGNSLVSTGDQALLKKVIASLDTDVTNGLEAIAPKAAAALRKADDIYMKGIKLLDSSFGDTIARLADNPTKIVDALFTPNSVDDVPRIFELIGSGKKGAERVGNVRAAFADKLVESARGDTGIMGKTLQKNIQRYGESTVRAIIGDEAFGVLSEITTLAKAVDAGQNVARGSQTAFTAKTAALMTAVFSGNIPLAASIAGGDKILSKLFTTEGFRKWITQGYVMPKAMEVAGKIAGQGARRGMVYGSQQFTE